MVRIIGTLLLIFISYLLQTSVFAMLPFLQTTPNLLLIITFSIGVLRGREEGLVYGMVCGLFLDLMSGGYIGFYGIIYMYIGLMCGFFYQHIDIDVPLISVGFCLGSEILYHLYIFVFRFLLRGRLGLLVYFQNIIMPEIVFTVIVAIFFYGGIMFLNGVLEDYEKRSALKFV